MTGIGETKMAKKTTLLSEVTKVDKDHYKPDPAYEWSNGEVKESTDGTDSGIYE